jgi:hypothetical protein
LSVKHTTPLEVTTKIDSTASGIVTSTPTPSTSIPEVVQLITEFPIVPQPTPTTTQPKSEDPANTESKVTTPTHQIDKEKLKEDRRKKAKLFMLLQNTGGSVVSVASPPTEGNVGLQMNTQTKF